MADVHVADEGTRFELTIEDSGVVVDVSAATIKTIKFLKPDGISVSKPADFVTDGSDGKIEYVTVTDDIDIKGGWKCQGYVELPSGKWHTSQANFDVSQNL